jgi:hypothetical protein
MPASAGCCDDFWSCAGAVATAGLSCAAQAALDALQALIRQTTSTRDDLNRRYEATLQAELDDLKAQIAEVDAEIKALLQQVEKALADGDRIFHEDQDVIRASLASTRAGLAGTPQPPANPSRQPSALRIAPTPTRTPTSPPSIAGPQKVSVSALLELQADPSLQQLRQRLDKLKAEKEALMKQILRKEAESGGLQMTQANAVATAARAAFAAQIWEPIGVLLGPLEAALTDPLNAAGVVNSTIALLDRLAKGVETLITRFVGALEQAGNQSLSVVQPEVDALRKVAAEAQAILDMMRKMTALRTAAARQALVKTLPATFSASSSAPRRLKSPAPLADRARAFGAPLAALKPGFERFTRTLGAVDTAPFRQRLAGEFDGYFRGKSPADAKKKLGELTAEARRRFASDPKKLAAVEKLLNDEARARGVPV